MAKRKLRHRLRDAFAAYRSARPAPNGRPSLKHGETARIPHTDLAAIRNRARELEQNTELMSSLLDNLEIGIVGTGIKPLFNVRDTSGEPLDADNDRLSNLYERWSEQITELTTAVDESTAQRLALRSFVRDGELSVIHHHDLPIEDGAIPYHYQLLRPESLDPSYTEEEDAWIRVNSYGIPTEYRFRMDLTRDRSRRVVVPANRVSHLAHRTSIGQRRGVSMFAPALLSMMNLDDLDEAHLVKAKIAASITMALKRAAGTGFGLTEASSDYMDAGSQLGTGTLITDLEPGDEIDLIESRSPAQELMAFRAAKNKQIAASGRASYVESNLDFDGSYSTQRMAVVVTAKIQRPLWKSFVTHFERPKFRNFIEAVMLRSGSDNRYVPSPNVDMNTVFRPVYTPPHVPYVDPTKEVLAEKMRIESGLDSKENILQSRGLDPRVVREQVRKERLADAELLREINEIAPAALESTPAETLENVMRVIDD